MTAFDANLQVYSTHNSINTNFGIDDSFIIPRAVWWLFSVLGYFASSLFTASGDMRNTEEIQNRALRNRPTEQHTKEVLEIIRKHAEEDVNSNVHFDEALIRRASVTRPNEPLPSIPIHRDSNPKRRSCPADLDINREVESNLKYRWRSLSDTPLLELRNRSPHSDRTATSPAKSDTSTKSRPRPARLSTNLPPLETEKQRLERPNCIPSLHRNGILLMPNEDMNMNISYENEDLLTENGINHHNDWTRG